MTIDLNDVDLRLLIDLVRDLEAAIQGECEAMDISPQHLIPHDQWLKLAEKLERAL